MFDSVSLQEIFVFPFFLTMRKQFDSLILYLLNLFVSINSSENLVAFSMSGVTRSLLPELDTKSPVREPFNMNSDPETEIISISASFEFVFFVEPTRRGEIAK